MREIVFCFFALFFGWNMRADNRLPAGAFESENPAPLVIRGVPRNLLNKPTDLVPGTMSHRIQTDTFRSGKSSLELISIVPRGGHELTLLPDALPVRPGAPCVLRLFYYLKEKNDNFHIWVKIEFLDSGRNVIFYRIPAGRGSSTGLWHEIRFEGKVPPGAAFLNFTVSAARGPYRIYLDDLSVQTP